MFEELPYFFLPMLFKGTAHSMLKQNHTFLSKTNILIITYLLCSNMKLSGGAMQEKCECICLRFGVEKFFPLNHVLEKSVKFKKECLVI